MERTEAKRQQETFHGPFAGIVFLKVLDVFQHRPTFQNCVLFQQVIVDPSLGSFIFVQVSVPLAFKKKDNSIQSFQHSKQAEKTWSSACLAVGH